MDSWKVVCKKYEGNESILMQQGSLLWKGFLSRIMVFNLKGAFFNVNSQYCAYCVKLNLFKVIYISKSNASNFFFFFSRFFFFFDVDPFQSLHWICYNIASVLCLGPLAVRQVGYQLPDQGSNPHPPHIRRLSPNHWTAREVPPLSYV